MKFKIWSTGDDDKVKETEFNYTPPQKNDYDMPMAHCDQSILHAPGACQYCDHYPQAQALREFWRINFTGEHDESKAPCPSEYFRPAELRDRWPGNTVRGYDYWTPLQ